VLAYVAQHLLKPAGWAVSETPEPVA
jgi:hypothetical protein